MSPEEFLRRLESMRTPTLSDIEKVAELNGLDKDYVVILLGTTKREGYEDDPYLYYGWASEMINKVVTIEDMQPWDPYHSGEANYYSKTNVTQGYQEAQGIDTVMKSVYLALTERNTKITECDGMYNSTPAEYNCIYKSSVYNCSIYELKNGDYRKD